MKAVILAAGRGSRLNRLTEDKPKCLNLVCGRPILQWQIDALRSCGIDEIIAVSGYRAEMLERPGIKTVHNREWERTNMVQSLFAAKGEFNHDLIVSYGDIIYKKTILDKLLKQRNDIVVVYDAEWRKLWEARFEDPLNDAESFSIDKDGLISDIGRKAGNIDDIQGQYTGLMRFSPTALEWISRTALKQDKELLDKMDMTTLLGKLIKDGHPVYGMPIKSGWCEIDTEKDLELANDLCVKYK